jgi:NitT/TauT family transport system permease protein
MNWSKRMGLVGIFALACLFVVVWWAASTQFSKIVLPSPLEVGRAFWEMASSGTMLTHISTTFYRVCFAFSMALGLGLAMGFIIARISPLQGAFERVVLLFQSIPSAIWIIMAIIWFGIGGFAPIFVIWAIAFPILALNVFEGVKNVDRELVEMGEIFGHEGQPIFTKIILPSIFPYLLTGSRVAMALSWKISVIAEVLGSSSGIGYAISHAYERLRTDEIFAWTIVIILILQAFDLLVFRRLEGRVKKYQIKP